MRTLQAPFRLTMGFFTMLTGVMVGAGNGRAAPGQAWVLGDASNDGKIDINDALLIAQPSPSKSIHLINADVNGDLRVDIVDALLVARRSEGLVASFPVETAPYAFQDASVASAVRQALGKGASDAVTVLELRHLPSLTVNCTASQAFALTDLKQMLGLSQLHLYGCTPSGWAGLSDLARLQRPAKGPTNPTTAGLFPTVGELGLYNVGLSDLGAVVDFDALEVLDLSWNGISSLSTLQQPQFGGLRTLVLDGNPLSGLAPLSALKSLTNLSLFSTGTTDITPISGLTSLVSVDLSWNFVSETSSLRNLTSLRTLDLNWNGLAETGLAPLASLPVLEELRLAWNRAPALDALTSLESLRTLDVRKTNCDTTSLASKPNLRIISSGSQMATCRPGSILGDADGDGRVTAKDVNAVHALLVQRDFFCGDATWSDDIRCVDLNGNQRIDAGDVQLIKARIAAPPATVPMGVACSSYSIVGDVDNDGKVTFSDVDIISKVVQGVIPASANICCLDVDGNGQVTSADTFKAYEIASGPPRPAAVCSGPHEGIGVVTYDLPLRSPQPCNGEPCDMPDATIDLMHARVMANPLLSATDIVLLPEFAYADRENPVQFVDDPASPSPPYLISNDNVIVQKVRALQRLALANQVVIAVPLAEQKIYSGTRVLWNSTVVIGKDGQIPYVRRKTYAVLGQAWPGLNDKLMEDWLASFQLMTFQTRTGTSFSSVIVVCSENSDQAMMQKMAAGSGQGPWHADVLLFPQALFVNQLSGDELMKRTQQMDNWPSPKLHQVVNTLATFVPYVDHIAYSGTELFSTRPQGIYAVSGQRLPYIFTDAMESGGYLYARIPAREP